MIEIFNMPMWAGLAAQFNPHFERRFDELVAVVTLCLNGEHDGLKAALLKVC
jgi:hypothetical protein